MTTDQPGRIGSGTVMSIHLANPATGVQFQYVVPAGTLIRLQGFYYRLVADATILNRNMGYELTDGVNVMLRLYNAFNIVAGITGELSGIAGTAMDAACGLPDNLALPIYSNAYLSAGMTIGSVVMLMQAGDQIEEPTLLIERWAVG